MELLQLDIVTPEGGIFSGKVKSVILPGDEGEFGVFYGHTDILSLLAPGVIEIEREDGKKELVTVNAGYVKVDNEKVDVLADGAVAIGGQNDGQIAAALNNAKVLLEQAKSDRIVAAAVVSRIENVIKKS